ncbi:MAG TPA: hypothetical protein VGF86_12280 [Candidatus Tumulicola sp.]
MPWRWHDIPGQLLEELVVEQDNRPAQKRRGQVGQPRVKRKSGEGRTEPPYERAHCEPRVYRADEYVCPRRRDGIFNDNYAVAPESLSELSGILQQPYWGLSN